MASNEFHLQVVTGRLRPLDKAIPMVEAVLAAGADTVQLRDVEPATAVALQALRKRQSLDRNRVVINGHPKAAGSFGMRWLHLPASWLESTPPFAKFDRVGMAVHSFDEAVEAEAIGADYVVFGHVFATQSHPGEAGRGTGSLAEVVGQLRIPVLAIGGIHHGNVAEALETGCAGVVVRSAIVDHPDSGLATTKMLEAIGGVTSRPTVALTSLPPLKRKG